MTPTNVFHDNQDESSSHRRELGAAVAINDTLGIINLAFAKSGISQSELATLLGVGPARISQILNGDGNIRVSTMGRLLAVLGFRANLELVPLEAPRPKRRRKKARLDAHTPSKRLVQWRGEIKTDSGFHPVVVSARNVKDPKTALPSAVLHEITYDSGPQIESRPTSWVDVQESSVWDDRTLVPALNIPTKPNVNLGGKYLV